MGNKVKLPAITKSDGIESRRDFAEKEAHHERRIQDRALPKMSPTKQEDVPFVLNNEALAAC